MLGLGNPIHIAFLLMLLLLVFGAKRLPEIGRSLGSGMRGFKDSLGGEEGALASLTAGEPAPTVQTAPTPSSAQTPAPSTVNEASTPRA